MNDNTEILELDKLPDSERISTIPEDEEQMKIRLQAVYNQISESNDPAEMTAIMISFDQYYNHGLTISNYINDRQGKNRLTVDHGSYKLNRYSLDINVDIYRQEQIQDMVILILNSYLSNKQVLPTNQPKKAAGILSRVKALYINLFNTNNYGFIHKLNNPPYMKPYLHKAFNMLKEMRDESLDGLIEYLEKIDEYEAANVIRETGEMAWRSIKTKTKDAFEGAFADVLNKLHNRKAVEDAYRKFRGNYKKSSRSIGQSMLYDILDITPNAYDTARQNVFAELSELASEDGHLRIINSILNER